MLKSFLLFIEKYLRKDLVLGKHTYGKPKVIRYGTDETAYVGKFCSIARNVTFILTGNHRSDWITTYPFPSFARTWKGAEKVKGHVKSKGDIVVGNDVWIGYGVLVLPGITVGDGAIVGANSVVTKDVPPYAIVAGNPAAVIRKRFTDKEIARLLKLQWWNWSDDEIVKLVPLLCNDISGLGTLEKKHEI